MEHWNVDVYFIVVKQVHKYLFLRLILFTEKFRLEMQSPHNGAQLNAAHFQIT